MPQVIKYKCVTAVGNDGEVIAIGYDESVMNLTINTQATDDYPGGGGKWCSFNFDTIPELAQDAKDWVDANSYIGSHLVVVSGAVRAKTLAELQAE